MSARKKATSPNPIPPFLFLVTDGQPISGYSKPCPTCGVPSLGPEGETRKKRFLSLGVAVLTWLSEEFEVFGAEDPTLRITANPAGPAVSGDCLLTAGSLRVGFSHHSPRASYGDFYMTSDKLWGVGAWCKWEELGSPVSLAVKAALVLDGALDTFAQKGQPVPPRKGGKLLRCTGCDAGLVNEGGESVFCAQCREEVSEDPEGEDSRA